MKNEKEAIRALIEKIGPDERAISRMENNILSASRIKTRKKFRPAVLAAAVLTALLAVGTISASPAVRRYFFPDDGIVEMTENDEAPLYMIMDSENHKSSDYDIISGYWHNGIAKVWITSEIKYEEIPVSDLFESNSASLELLGVHYDSINGYSQTYLLEYADVSWDIAYEGLSFGDNRLCFIHAPVEYQPYVLENCGIRLTLIPLTLDLTTFAAETEYIDGHDSIELWTKSSYSTPRDAYAMYLTDELGNKYPLKRLKNSSVLTISEVPEAPITGFTADYIVIHRNFDDPTVIPITVPSDGEAVTADIDFTFPDGVTKGNISAVGYNNLLYTKPSEEDDPFAPYDRFEKTADSFPLGYLTVITDAMEQNGVEYWYELTYTDEYHDFLGKYIAVDVRSPYDNPSGTLSPGGYVSSMSGLEGQVRHIAHYIPDGNDSVYLQAYRYEGIAYGDWVIDFTSAE